MTKIGIISDTHGVFDETLKSFLADVDQIWHAGDIGSLELADRIAAFKPLRAVCGNIDAEPTRREFPEFMSFECEGIRVLMTHIGGYANRYQQQVAEMMAAQKPDIFVSGHSHILKIFREHTFGTLCINPGAAGRRGIHAVRTAVRLTLDDGRIENVEVGEWPR
ncbi:MAG: metallophosphatase family protein [Alistipes sp.]|jgi:putative phosphoesterase|nr:metallophosphatase family protein [Alistipes sp.]